MGTGAQAGTASYKLLLSIDDQLVRRPHMGGNGNAPRTGTSCVQLVCAPPGKRGAARARGSQSEGQRARGLTGGLFRETTPPHCLWLGEALANQASPLHGREG